MRTETEGHARHEERTHDGLEGHGTDTEGAHLHVGFTLAGAADLAETRHDFFFEHRPEFERRTREHDERAAVAMQEDTGRGTARIGQRVGAGRDVALAEIRGGDLAADQFEAIAQGLLGGGHMREGKSEGAGDGFTRMVVGGRTDAAGGDDEVVGTPGFADGTGDLGGVVPDDEGAGDGQAAAGEMLAQPEEVAVLAETVEELVAHVDDEDLSGSAVAGKHLRKRGVPAGLKAQAQNANRPGRTFAQGQGPACPPYPGRLPDEGRRRAGRLCR